MARKWDDYIDKFGLVVHKDGGGDSGQRTSMRMIGIYCRGVTPYTEVLHVNDYRLALKAVEVGWGVYIRHPQSTAAWHSDPKEFSRDQQTPLVIALGMYAMYGRLLRLFIRHLLRFGKYQNEDWMGPEHFGQYVRAFGPWALPLWPVLFVTDLFMILGVMIRCYQAGKDPDDVGDDLNQILSLIQARDWMPTLFSWVARRYYAKNRPANLGSMTFGVHPVIGAVKWYFREDQPSGPPPMDELFEGPIIDYILT